MVVVGVVVGVAVAVVVVVAVGVGIEFVAGIAFGSAVVVAVAVAVVAPVAVVVVVAVVVGAEMMHPKRKPWRSKAYTQAAEGQPCTLRSPVCNGDPATTVFCHLNESWAGKGMGQKADDFAGFDGCSACHQWYDSGRNAWLRPGSKPDAMLLRAMYETIRNRLDRGILKEKRNA